MSDPAAAATCALCRNARPVVVLADDEHRERPLCVDCWHRLAQAMPGLKALHFYGEPGKRL